MLSSAKLSLVFLAANAAFASAQVKVIERDLPSPLFADGSYYDVMDILPAEGPDNLAPQKYGASQGHHHHSPTWGPSQYHHKTSTPGTWDVPVTSTDGPSHPILTRPGSHPTQPILTHQGPSPTVTKAWGPSQHHHKPSKGPSQYHHHDTPSASMRVGVMGGDDKPWDKPEYQNPKATDDGYTPGVPGMGGNQPGNSDPAEPEGPRKPKVTPDGPRKPMWASASASARARLNKANENAYALYGNAAADVCGLDAQMTGAEITACPLEGGASGWDCLNLASTLESCGGCMSLGEGQDCTLIKGADSVKCIFGKCSVGSCEEGYWLDSSKNECVAVA